MAKLASSFLKSRLALIALIGLAVRIALLPFTYDFDIYHWALITENINSGNNLYEIAGYYYTPIWGYFLGFISMVDNLFLGVDVMGVMVPELLPIEDLTHPYHISNIATFEFTLLMKIPLIICDILVACIIYEILLRFTGDVKKATWGFGLWFLCPIVVYMSSVQAMFDTFSALLMLLTVWMIYKDRCILGGAMFSVAVLLKFFPAFCIFVLIGYIWARHRHDGLARKRVVEAAIGAIVTAAVLLIPQILNGQFMDMFSFIFGRADNFNIMMALFTALTAVIALFGSAYGGYRMVKAKDEDVDKALFENILLVLTCAILMTTTPQYVIIMIPFLLIYAMTRDSRHLKLLTIISLGAVIAAFILNNFSLLCTISLETSMVSPEWIVSHMQALEGKVFGITYVEIINWTSNALQYIGVALVALLLFSETLFKKAPGTGTMRFRSKRMRGEIE